MKELNVNEELRSYYNEDNVEVDFILAIYKGLIAEARTYNNIEDESDKKAFLVSESYGFAEFMRCIEHDGETSEKGDEFARIVFQEIVPAFARIGAKMPNEGKVIIDKFLKGE